jgi:hypothetical protein
MEQPLLRGGENAAYYVQQTVNQAETPLWCKGTGARRKTLTLSLREQQL